MNNFEFILRENVLTDNILIVPQKGFIFKGGYIAIIKEYTFATAWSDKEHIKMFRKKESLYKYLDKHYKEFELDFLETCLNY